jgi:hypothetical protein
MFKICASQQWLHTTLSLNEQDFARLLVHLMIDFAPDNPDAFDSLHNFVCNFMYPNLLYNHHIFVLNLKPSNRAFLGKLT